MWCNFTPSPSDPPRLRTKRTTPSQSETTPTGQVYHIGNIIGTGAYAHVFDAVSLPSQTPVAIKKSRVSQKVKRPILRHESRILHLLQGHPGIPVIYGYAHLPHFEYIAMEHLGPTLDEVVSGPVREGVVVRVVLQMLSALEHIYARGIVHRDVKLDNILCRNTRQVVLIDFGLATQIKSSPTPEKDERYAYSERIIGTLQWASVNAHNSIDLGPRDDLESLSYVAFALLRGLPWTKSTPTNAEEEIRHRSWVGRMKEAAMGEILSAGFPKEFGKLLDYARGLEYGQVPDYERLKREFENIWTQLGGDVEEELDWTPVSRKIEPVSLSVERPTCDENPIPVQNDNKRKSRKSNSYFEADLDIWDDIQCERHKSLTFPADEVEVVDCSIPVIGEVTRVRKFYEVYGGLFPGR